MGSLHRPDKQPGHSPAHLDSEELYNPVTPGDIRAQGHGALHLRDERQGAPVSLPPAAGPLLCRGGRGPPDGAQPGLPRHHITQGEHQHSCLYSLFYFDSCMIKQVAKPHHNWQHQLNKYFHS